MLVAYPIDPAKPCKGFGENTLWIISEADQSMTTHHGTDRREMLVVDAFHLAVGTAEDDIGRSSATSSAISP